MIGWQSGLCLSLSLISVDSNLDFPKEADVSSLDRLSGVTHIDRDGMSSHLLTPIRVSADCGACWCLIRLWCVDDRRQRLQNV